MIAAGPHPFDPLTRRDRRNVRGRCRHCLVHRLSHPVLGWPPARALGDRSDPIPIAEIDAAWVTGERPARPPVGPPPRHPKCEHWIPDGPESADEICCICTLAPCEKVTVAMMAEHRWWEYARETWVARARKECGHDEPPF